MLLAPLAFPPRWISGSQLCLIIVAFVVQEASCFDSSISSLRPLLLSVSPGLQSPSSLSQGLASVSPSGSSGTPA